MAIILPPAIVAAAAVASAGAMLYGCGKVLEGIGRGLAYVPEILYRACVGKQVKNVAAKWRGRRRAAQGEDVEAGAIVSVCVQPIHTETHHQRTYPLVSNVSIHTSPFLLLQPLLGGPDVPLYADCCSFGCISEPEAPRHGECKKGGNPKVSTSPRSVRRPLAWTSLR
ncbi:hypothetical protein C8T65DRAFT_656344 [Cerioporus squamosus]|nr:hypothetical protein C8T65DRAFT_656344 [Cerioporus squamosus]